MTAACVPHTITLSMGVGFRPLKKIQMKPPKPQSRFLRLGVTVLPRKLRQAAMAKRSQQQQKLTERAEHGLQQELLVPALEAEGGLPT
jgi:hypothetical protein